MRRRTDTVVVSFPRLCNIGRGGILTTTLSGIIAGMDEHTLTVLEFDKVKAQLRSYATCQLGLDQIDRLQPCAEVRWIQRALDEVTEARRIFAARRDIPMGGIRDIRPLLEKAGLGVFLHPMELLDVQSTLAAARRLRAFLMKHPDETPLLSGLGRSLGVFQKIEDEIERCISQKGEVVDAASPVLAQTRSRLRITHSRVMDRLNSIIKSAHYRTIIQEPVITMRDGRYCIPVKAEHRREFKGLVHDQSASGATVFMEPADVVELGNEIRELEIKEQQEVERILRRLTDLIASQLGGITNTVAVLGHLDLIYAKARWAEAMDASAPQLDIRGRLDLVHARHPLLEGNVVPIDVRLGDEFQALLITGPNTGGKTVTLKTIGLLTLMTMAGMHIPADEGSRVAVFTKVFADIGDEQSIQQSLSTFSSHIRQIIKIINQADNHTLALLDEIGAGTDPEEGAALAKAILKELLARGSRVVASTHYGELKEFAYSHPGIRNASVEFDQETLRPTYRLVIGIPGSSHAINIAARLGMPENVIQSAREMFSPERAPLEELYRALEEDRRAAEAGRESAKQTLAELERLRKQYLKELEELRSKRAQAAAMASAQAREIIRKAREEAEAALAQLRRAAREGRETQEARDRLARALQEAERVQSQAEEIKHAPQIELPPAEPDTVGSAEVQGPPEVGDTVVVSPFQREGILVRLDGDQAEVQIGAVRMNFPISSLRRVRARTRRPDVRTSLSQITLAKAQNISNELHLRSMRADEALLTLEKYLDDARLAGISPVRIIHGRGTGALRRMVWEYLKDAPDVKCYCHAPPEEGGEGVTVVELALADT
ncbi:MAG: endonuclease MutS2 [Armatimonadota bacterium]